VLLIPRQPIPAEPLNLVSPYPLIIAFGNCDPLFIQVIFLVPHQKNAQNYKITTTHNWPTWIGPIIPCFTISAQISGCHQNFASLFAALKKIL